MIITADVSKWCETYEGDPFHALLCDAPYEMAMMNSKWDASGVAFDPETWRALARHLLPGAYLFVFAGTLNDDLISVAMREAGLRKHHKALVWIAASGFPKATQISSQVDRAAGAERQTTGQRVRMGDKQSYETRGDSIFTVSATGTTTAPATPLAAAWEGHRYGGQAIKPAADPLLIFQKPYEGRPVDSITRTGAGALNIAGGRIPVSDTDTGGWRPNCADTDYRNDGIFGVGPNVSQQHPGGRWPSNLLLIHNEQCAAVCVEGCPIRVLGEQSGESRSAGQYPTTYSNSAGYGGGIGKVQGPLYDDEGTAARYFHQSDYVYERLEAAAPFYYQAKSSTAEREAGLGDWQQTTVDDGRQTPIDNPYLRGETQRRNTHPCTKPISLIKHLAQLLLPPDEYAPRRILIPFCGVSSEMIGAHLAGWESITGIEQDAEYCRIGRARLDWWRTAARRLMTTEPETILAMQEQAAQPNLFDLEDL